MPILAASLGVAALLSSPARANLELQVSDDGGTFNSCSTCNDSSNTTVAWDGGNLNNDFIITAIGALGVGAFFGDGELIDLSNLETSSLAAGTLTVELTETNLSAGTVATFLSKFTGTLTNISVTRTFYLNTDNLAFGTEFTLGTTTMAEAMNVVTHSLSGQFSLTEVVQIVATGPGGSLSTDDNVFLVPEPVSLSIFGSGLLALGALSRRRRKPAKSA
jgi:hypothetical protein